MDVLGQLGGLGALSAAGLLGLMVLLIMRGDLVPRKIHEEVKADRDGWRKALDAERARHDLRAEQMDALLEGQETTIKLIEAFQREANS